MISKVSHIVTLSVFLLIAIGFHLFFITTNQDYGNLNVVINYTLPIYLYGAFICLYRTKNIKGAVGKAHLLCGLALLTYSIATFLWTTMSIRLGEIPYPSVPDIFYILFYPLFIAGIFYFLSTYEYKFTKVHLITTSIVAILSAFVTIEILGLPGPDTEIIERVFDYVYILADIVLITACLLVLQVTGGSISRGLLYIIIGVAVQAVADFVFALRNDSGLYIDGGITDLLYALSGYFMALGIVLSVVIQETFNSNEKLDF